MKNVARKKTDYVLSSPEPRDLRAEVEKRAYEIWLSESGGHGCDLDHWLRAEHELAVTPVGRQ